MSKDLNTRERILDAAAKMFASKGFDGSSVRDICKVADASSNSVNHYFDSKEKLLEEIFDQYDSRIFSTPLKIIETKVKNKAEFEMIFKIFFSETLRLMLENSCLVAVVLKENNRCCMMTKMQQYHASVVSFIERGQELGFVHKDLKAAMISGTLMDRLFVQVAFKGKIRDFSKMDIEDPEYQEEWIDQSVKFFLHGLISQRD